MSEVQVETPYKMNEKNKGVGNNISEASINCIRVGVPINAEHFIQIGGMRFTIIIPIATSCSFVIRFTRWL